MATKKDKVEQAKEAVDKKQKEAALENDITTLPGLGGSGKKSGSNTSSSKSTGNKTGTTGGDNKSNGGNKSTGSNVTSEQRGLIDAIGTFEKELETERNDAEAYNQQKAEEHDFDTKKGRSEYYQSLGTISKEKDRAQERLDKLLNDNKLVSENRALKETYQNALKSDKKAKKETEKLQKSYNKANKDQIQGLESKIETLDKRNKAEIDLHDANATLNSYLDVAREDLRQNKEGFEDDAWLAKFDELNQIEKDATEMREKALKTLEELGPEEKIEGDLGEYLNTLKEEQKKLTSGSLDVLMEWANANGSDDDKARASTIKSLMDAVRKADEDGVLTKEEAAQIKQLGKECDRLIKQEMENDPELRDAQDALDSAKAKFSYFLFDQIKSIAAFMIGLSQGNPQMIYSALDSFNKQIADAEAGYNTDTIKAFSNNNVKSITGESDAEYTIRTEILPELKKQKAFQDLSEREKEVSVRALEKAFEEYRRYANKGGGDDFRAWFTAQTANGNGSGWASVITTLIQAGALNWDAIIKAFGGGTTSQPTPKSKGKDVSFNLGTQGQTNEAMQNILRNLSGEAVAKQSTPQVTRDKQNTVVNSLASKIPQQPSAPQNGPVQVKSNSRWNAIG